MLTLARCGLAIMALAVLIGCDERPRLMRHCRSGTWPPGIDSLIWPHPAGTTRTASLIFAWFSGGGTRAASLAYGALRELARQQVTWEARRSGCSMSWISFLPCPAGLSRAGTMRCTSIGSFRISSLGSCARTGIVNSDRAFCGPPAIGFAYGRPILDARTS
jgi:hypothetical protein